MGMKELYISMYIEWVNRNTWFTYLLMSTFSYMDNVQRIYLYICYMVTVYVEIFRLVIFF